MARKQQKIEIKEDLKIDNKQLYTVKKAVKSTINKSVFNLKQGDTVLLSPFEYSILSLYLEEDN